jgi:hypothetical protein
MSAQLQPQDLPNPFQVEEQSDRGIWLFVDSFKTEAEGIAEMARLDESTLNMPRNRRMKIYRLVRVIHYVRAW